MAGISVPDELVQLAKERRVRRVFDCGSRDGRDGLYLADAIGAEELHVFECNPPSAAKCRENAAAYRGQCVVHVHEVAVSDTEGSVTFYAIDTENTVTPHKDGNPGASSLYRANPEYPHERYVQRPITVQAKPLLEYAEKYGAPDLLWMDLQGAELNALKGFGNSLEQVGIIYTEVSFRPMYLGQPLFHDIDQYAVSRGFTRHALRLGRWPNIPALYRLARFGPWVGDAIYTRPIGYATAPRQS